MLYHLSIDNSFSRVLHLICGKMIVTKQELNCGAICTKNQNKAKVELWRTSLASQTIVRTILEGDKTHQANFGAPNRAFHQLKRRLVFASKVGGINVSVDGNYLVKTPRMLQRLSFFDTGAVHWQRYIPCILRSRSYLLPLPLPCTSSADESRCGPRPVAAPRSGAAGPVPRPS